MIDGKWKSTIVIWSDFDPNSVELTALAYEADQGSAICTDYDFVFVAEPTEDPQFEGAEEFFMSWEDDDTI